MNALIDLGYLLLMFLPNSLKLWVMNRFCGCNIHRSAKIGFSFIRVGKLVLAEGASIKHFNLIRNLELFELQEKASVGNFNQFTAIPLHSTVHFADEKNRYPSLVLGRHSAIVSRHYFDCNNAIHIGHHSIIAGRNTLFYTHGISVSRNRQETHPIRIGNYCMLGAAAVILKGAVLPDYSVLAANSTLSKAHEETHAIYSGVPAIPVKSLDRSAQYFHREEGFVP
jgi:acetyltransferase-like isoleucine patch superfamily enzyme